MRPREDKWAIRTGRCELRVKPLAHYTLQSQASTHEYNGNERQYIRPQGIPAVIGYAPFPTFPYRQRSRHGEQCLDERAQYEPCP